MDITQLIPQFGSFAWTVVAFIVALSVIVAIHEYGHYIVGRWSGIKADVFSLGFGPVLYSWTDRHGTKWQIAALPFGGYVKFHGDANAASATDEAAVAVMDEEEARSTMAGAPLWARAATVAAGPVFNFVLSIAIFAGVFFFNGEVREPLTIGKLYPLPVETELQEGDVILEIAGLPLPPLGDAEASKEFVEALPIEPVLDYRIRRGDREMVVKGPFPYPPIATGLAPQSAAFAADMRVGDVIVAVDGEPIVAFEQVKEKVESSNGRPLTFDVWRNGKILRFAVAPRRVDEPLPDGGFQTTWRIGISGGLFFEPATERTGILEAFQGGVWQTWRIITGSISGLGHMVTGAISSCNLSGPIGIAQTSGQMASQGAENFIWFIAVLSAAVGLLNLFPVPMLDGGHLVFYAWEAVTRRRPSERVMQVLMALGLATILTLMGFALFNDLFCP